MLTKLKDVLDVAVLVPEAEAEAYVPRGLRYWCRPQGTQAPGTR